MFITSCTAASSHTHTHTQGCHAPHMHVTQHCLTNIAAQGSLASPACLLLLHLPCCLLLLALLLVTHERLLKLSILQGREQWRIKSNITNITDIIDITKITTVTRSSSIRAPC